MAKVLEYLKLSGKAVANLIPYVGEYFLTRDVRDKSFRGMLIFTGGTVRISSLVTILKLALGIPSNSIDISIASVYPSSTSGMVYFNTKTEYNRLCTPNDENFEEQWALNNSGQHGGTPDADIDAVEAWDIEKGDSYVVIASVDSGVEYTHPDLADNIWNNEDEIPDNGIDDDENGFIDDICGWDFVENDNQPLDTHLHGTACAGVHSMVTNNSIGGAGVCWHLGADHAPDPRPLSG